MGNQLVECGKWERPLPLGFGTFFEKLLRHVVPEHVNGLEIKKKVSVSYGQSGRRCVVNGKGPYQGTQVWGDFVQHGREVVACRGFQLLLNEP